MPLGMRDFWDIVKNYIASVLFWVSGGLLGAAALDLLAFVKRTTRHGVVLVIDPILLFLICAAVVAGICAIIIWRWPLHTFHFRGKREINRCREYFNVLWERSTPIKSGAVVYHEVLNGIRAHLGAD